MARDSRTAYTVAASFLGRGRSRAADIPASQDAQHIFTAIRGLPRAVSTVRPCPSWAIDRR